MKLTTGVFALGLLTACSSVFADDIAEGEKLYKDKTCLSCHGDGGEKPIMASYPKLGGQSAEYTVQQLKDFKSGARSNAQAAVMLGILASVSEEEMTKIAAYLASVGAEPAAQ